MIWRALELNRKNLSILTICRQTGIQFVLRRTRNYGSFDKCRIGESVVCHSGSYAAHHIIDVSENKPVDSGRMR